VFTSIVGSQNSAHPGEGRDPDEKELWFKVLEAAELYDLDPGMRRDER
jgi:hypothetical protein